MTTRVGRRDGRVNWQLEPAMLSQPPRFSPTGTPHIIELRHHLQLNPTEAPHATTTLAAYIQDACKHFNDSCDFLQCNVIRNCYVQLTPPGLPLRLP